MVRALYCDSTILRKAYIATNLVLSQYRAQNALYCDSTILRQMNNQVLKSRIIIRQ